MEHDSVFCVFQKFKAGKKLFFNISNHGEGRVGSVRCNPMHQPMKIRDFDVWLFLEKSLWQPREGTTLGLTKVP